MLIRAWRLQNRLTLAEAKGLLGFESASYLNGLEHGEHFASGSAAARILHITGAIGPEAVTPSDLLIPWQIANRDTDLLLRRKSRAVAREFRRLRQQQEQKEDGRKAKGRRKRRPKAEPKSRHGKARRG